MAFLTMRMNQSKNFIRVEIKLRTEFTVPFLDVAFHCENEQSVLYIHVRDFAPAREINAEKCLHSKFQKIHLLPKKKLVI